MITDIRRGFKHYLVQAAVWLTLFSMVGFFLPTMLRRSEGPLSELLINGMKISQQTIARRVQMETERVALLRQQWGGAADTLLAAYGLDNPASFALHSLVQETLLDQAAAHCGLATSSTLLAHRLRDPYYIARELGDLIPLYVFDQNGVINIETLQRHLQRAGMNMNQLETAAAGKMQRTMLTDLLAAGALIEPAEVEKAYDAQYLERTYEVIEFPYESYLRKVRQQAPSEKELENFYQKNRSSYTVPEERTAQGWQFNPATYGIEVTPQEMQTYYNNNKVSKFTKEPVRIQVRRILLKVNQEDATHIKEREAAIQEIHALLLKEPQRFEELAHEKSEDVASAKKGGLLEPFARKERSAALEKAAFRLREDGALSDIIQTEDGFEIIQRVKRIPAQYIPLEEASAEIKKQLIKQKFVAHFEKEVRNALENGGSSKEEALQAFAKAHKGSAITFGPRTKENNALSSKLFRAQVGEWVYALYEGNGMLLRLKKVTPKYTPALAEIKDKVTEEYHAEKARSLIAHDIQEAMDPARNEGIKAVLQYYPEARKVSAIEPFSFKDREVILNLQQQDLPVKGMLSLKKVGEVASQMGDASGYIIYFAAQSKRNPELYQAEYTKIEQKLYEDQKAVIEQGFVASLQRHAKIEGADLYHSFIPE
jgi:peptidyl-prolyl cis-trans isomerase D